MLRPDVGPMPASIVDLFRSRAALEAERLVLRRQIIVLRQRAPKKLPFGPIDKLMLARVCRCFANAYKALAIVSPETAVRRHRAGFQSCLALDVEEPSWSTGDPV